VKDRAVRVAISGSAMFALPILFGLVPATRWLVTSGPVMSALTAFVWWDGRRRLGREANEGDLVAAARSYVNRERIRMRAFLPVGAIAAVAVFVASFDLESSERAFYRAAAGAIAAVTAYDLGVTRRRLVRLEEDLGSAR
jgi:hypothetical protein